MKLLGIPCNRRVFNRSVFTSLAVAMLVSPDLALAQNICSADGPGSGGISRARVMSDATRPSVNSLPSVNLRPAAISDAAQADGAGSSASSANSKAAEASEGKTSPFTLPDDRGPDSDALHDLNKTLRTNQLSLHSAVSLYSFKNVRDEIGYDQPITLDEALAYALRNNLAIKISEESYKYQRYVLMGNIASTLPSFSMAYDISRTHITNQKINSLARVQLERLNYPVFQGGSVVYGILAQAFRERGWAQAYKASVNDTLLQVYQSYNNLLLARVLLQIRAKAVEVDEEQMRVNQQLEAAGVGTRLAVMQSDAQLATDRQALIQQQVAVRQAALALNFVLNYPMSVNLVPIEETITEQSLFRTNSRITEIVKTAIKHRPELREYEYFKFGAARNLQIASAPLYPQLAFFTAISYTNTTTQRDTGTVAASTGSASTSGAGVFGGQFSSTQNGMGLTWNLNGMGLTNVANIFGAQSLNRQAGIQANQELQTVMQQVRSDYLAWRAAREQIDNAAHGTLVSAEELRLSSIRLRQGVGTNLEVIQAQRDYINALTTQAQAIVGSNMAQAQLLHDVGIINADTLLHGYKGNLN